MKLSIVTTLYKSEATVAAFVARATAAAHAITDDYEIVMVDDGSPDRSLEIAIGLVGSNPHLRVVELSRNFGHHKALMTGLQQAKGDYCFLIDSDLEEAPELLGSFWEILHSEDKDVVYGMQERRAGSLFRRWTGAIAYRVFDWLLAAKIPTNHLTVRLMRRNYVDALLLHRETQLIIGGLWAITGFRQLGQRVDKTVKVGTTYRPMQLWSIFLDSITNFSAKPLVAIFYVGLLIFMTSMAVSLWLLFRWAAYGVSVEGWVSVMLSVWVLGGLAILFIGVIGIYLSKIFLETKGRPLSIIRLIHGNGHQ
ncbi:MAG: glycosyltransferase family 2 protein [Rhizobiaceae bacterium]|nr:glycosyltransferase family 2 protein [Rhizobiaceae bacterium]